MKLHTFNERRAFANIIAEVNAFDADQETAILHAFAWIDAPDGIPISDVYADHIKRRMEALAHISPQTDQEGRGGPVTGPPSASPFSGSIGDCRTTIYQPCAHQVTKRLTSRTFWGCDHRTNPAGEPG
jgi:hypothetical protein